MYQKCKQMLSLAIKLSAMAHYGQFDNTGRPYFIYLMEVMTNLKSLDNDLNSIAILHGIFQHTDTKPFHLIDLGFSDRVIDGVRSMTRLENQSTAQYKAQIKSNPDSVKIKSATTKSM